MRDSSPLNRHFAPLLAMAGAGLPWIVYDLLIENPSYFWTFRGAIFMATAILGVISVVLAWRWSHGYKGSEEDNSFL